MKDIKTRESKRDIKTLDRAAGLAKVTKNTAVLTKDQVQNLSDDGQITPDEYADLSFPVESLAGTFTQINKEFSGFEAFFGNFFVGNAAVFDFLIEKRCV